MYSIERHEGRLIEARLGSPMTLDEVERCIFRIRTLVTSMTTNVIFCVDMTRTNVLPPDAAEKFLAMMRVDNPLVERTGYLLPDANAVIGLQMERLIREARNPVRKAFRDKGQLIEWLSKVMTPAEAARLQIFMANIVPS